MKHEISTSGSTSFLVSNVIVCRELRRLGVENNFYSRTLSKCILHSPKSFEGTAHLAGFVESFRKLYEGASLSILCEFLIEFEQVSHAVGIISELPPVGGINGGV